MTSPATLLSLCEQLVPTEKKIETYINPLVKYMTDEWRVIKNRLASNMVSIASGELMEAKSDVWFPQGKQNLVYQQYDGLMKSYKSEINDRVKDITKQAKFDSNMQGITDWADTTPIQIVLSKKGVEDVIKELKWQRDFIDDYSKDAKSRIRALLKSRYGSLGEFRSNVNRTFRIDRDSIIDKFKSEVWGHADKVIDGRMTAEDFVSVMRTSIEDHYKRAYRAGKGVQVLDELEEELILRQAQGQMQYLNNFSQYISQKQALGKELTSQVRARAGLYAERGSAIFEAGAVAGMPADVLLDWKMNPAEHCITCPIFASNSPYTKETLPGYPGEGFHLTQCGTNCNCDVVVSDLYVTQRDLWV